MIVRAYLDSDLGQLIRVFEASVRELTLEHYDASQREAWAMGPGELNRWRSRLAALQTIVAEDDDQLAGFLSYEWSGHIDLLYVAPRHARRGVASRLYRHAEARLAGADARELFTESSLSARAFFEHHGFRIVQPQTVLRASVPLQRYVMRKALQARAYVVPSTT